MEDRIEFDSVITEKALNDFKMYHVFHNVGGVFGYVFAAFAIVMCVLGVIFKMSPKYIVMMGLFGVFFFFYPIVNMRLGTKKQMKTVVAFKEPMHYSAGEDKIIVSQGDITYYFKTSRNKAHHYSRSADFFQFRHIERQSGSCKNYN